MWIVKDSGGKYYSPINSNAIHFVNKQSGAQRFNSKEEAISLSKYMNSTLRETRVVKLKCYESLLEPKIGTVFIEQARPNVPCIVTSIAYGDDIEVWSFDHVDGKGNHCTLKSYWEYLNRGKIKIIWEPK